MRSRCAIKLASSLLFILAGGQFQAHSASPRIIQEFDVASGGDGVLLPVTFKGKTYLFLLDTGTEVTTFDAALRADLGASKGTTQITTSNGRAGGEMFDAPKATIARIRLETEGVVTSVDPSAARKASGLDMCGVLGMDFLQRHVVRIDFDAGKVQFLKSVDPNDQRLGKPLAILNNQPRKPVVIGAASLGRAVDFLVDTGATATGTGPLRPVKKRREDFGPSPEQGSDRLRY
jgi:hypothetical protein